MKAPPPLTAAPAIAADAPASAPGAASDDAPETLFQETVKSTDSTDFKGDSFVACGSCFYCDQEMPSCCEGVIGGADPRDPLPRRRRRPSPLRRLEAAAPRLLTVRWARRALVVARD